MPEFHMVFFGGGGADRVPLLPPRLLRLWITYTYSLRETSELGLESINSYSPNK